MNRVMQSLLVLAATAAAGAACANAQSLYDLGVVAGHNVSKGFDINQDGTVAVGYSANTALTAMRAIRWTLAGGTQDLGTLGGLPKSYARSCDTSGNIVAVGLQDAGGAGYGARWTNPGGLVGISSPVTAAPFSVNGMSEDGAFIVGDLPDFPTGSTVGARWSLSTGFQSLGQIQAGGSNGHATAANQDGSRIVGWGWQTNNTANGVYASRWISGVQTNLGYYFFNNTYMFAINPAGNVLAGIYRTPSVVNAPPHAWRRVDQPVLFSVDDLGTLPGRTGSTAMGLSVDGNAIVGNATGGAFPTTSTGILWSTTMGLWDLNSFLANNGFNMTGWQILEAQAISTDGQAIVGTAIHNGAERAFVARGINCLQKPAILEQSGAVAICPGSTAFFSVFPGGQYTTTFSYNWRRNGILIADGPNVYGSSFAGTQTANFSIIGATSNDVANYDCVIGNPCGLAYSTPVGLTMLASGPPSVLFLPASVPVCNGSNASFTIGANNATTYNWEINLPFTGWTLVNDGFFVDFFSGWSCVVSGANTPTITFNGINMASLNNVPVRCGLANACYSLRPTDPSYIYLDGPPTITAIYSNVDECYPSYKNFTVIATGVGPLTYQWQKRNGFNNVWYNLSPGAVTELFTNFTGVYSTPQASNMSYTIADLGFGNFSADFRCLVSNGCGTTIAGPITHSWHCESLCPADFDGSGGVPDIADLNAFWAAWLNGDECADIDCSGGTPDAADVQLFYDLWLAGGCDVPCPECP